MPAPARRELEVWPPTCARPAPRLAARECAPQFARARASMRCKPYPKTCNRSNACPSLVVWRGVPASGGTAARGRPGGGEGAAAHPQGGAGRSGRRKVWQRPRALGCTRPAAAAPPERALPSRFGCPAARARPGAQPWPLPDSGALRRGSDGRTRSPRSMRTPRPLGGRSTSLWACSGISITCRSPRGAAAPTLSSPRTSPARSWRSPERFLEGTQTSRQATLAPRAARTIKSARACPPFLPCTPTAARWDGAPLCARLCRPRAWKCTRSPRAPRPPTHSCARTSAPSQRRTVPMVP